MQQLLQETALASVTQPSDYGSAGVPETSLDPSVFCAHSQSPREVSAWQAWSACAAPALELSFR